MSVDTSKSLLADRVSDRDDGLVPGDGKDGVFDVGVTGSFDALILLSVGDGQGQSLGDATLVWDTLVGGQPFPQSISGRYRRGADTAVLGVSVDGTSLVNGPDGSIPPFGPGPHQIKIFANAVGNIFRSGQYFRLVLLSRDTPSWGPPIQFSWGRPAINAMSVAPGSTLVNRVGEGDGEWALQPGGEPDGAFDVDLTGPLDVLFLVGVASSGVEMIWDTLVGSAPFPASVATNPVYQRGNDTWVLGVADSSGDFLNNRDGTLPRINGRSWLTIYATDTYNRALAPMTSEGGVEFTVLQLVGLIGDQTIWGPRVVLSVPASP